MPEFPGGLEALQKHLSTYLDSPKQSFQLHFPRQALKSKMTGVVYVSFVIGADGLVKEPMIAKGIGPECDREAIRLISAMPRWKIVTRL